MVAWWGRCSEFFKLFLLPMVGVLILTAVVACLPWWTLSFHLKDKKLGSQIDEQIKTLGSYGDMFGMLNIVFSGAAFCAIFATLRIQQRQHEIQIKELNMKRAIADLVVDTTDSARIYKTHVPGGSSNNKADCPARYVRIALNNAADVPARGCRVMLTAVHKKKSGHDFELVEESNRSLRLLHFTEKDDSPEDRVISIPFNVPQHFNLCSLKRDPPNGATVYSLIQVAHGGSKYDSLNKEFELNHEYKFFVSIDSENSAPQSVEIIVSVGKDLEEIKVLNVKVIPKKGKRVYAEDIP